MVGTAVKVTLVPEQILPAGSAVMLTDGATEVVTDIVIELDVAVLVDVQSEFEVRIQVTISLFAKVEFE